MFTLFLAALCAVSMAAQAPKIDTSGIGPRVGQKVPDFAGTDQLGRKHTFASSLGAKGAMLVFFRSADWWPYCKTQLVELQGRYDDIRKQGLGLIAISYDSPETLKKFADSRGISFPLISDAGSAIIKRYGILNEQQEPGTRSYGIPHPGTFIVDRNGVVTARFFEDAYQERYTAAAILVAQGANPDGASVTAQTNHLTMSASISDSTVAPGERLSIVVVVTPRPTMHVYAPGKHDYRVVRLSVDPQPWLRAHDTRYPPSEIYHFKPLNERVAVYSKPFRLVQDITILGTPEIQKSLAVMPTVTIAGTLEYQACDDKVCYNPARVPLSFTLTTKALDRRPPG